MHHPFSNVPCWHLLQRPVSSETAMCSEPSDAIPPPTWLVICALGLLWLVGCAQFDRAPAVPSSDAGQASVLGISNARYLAEGDPSPMIAEFRRAYAREVAFLNSVHRPLPDS